MIVMKFGGTSVEDSGAIEQLCAIVLVSLDRRELVPLVCNPPGPRAQVHTESGKALVSLVAERIREFAISPRESTAG